MGEGPVELLDAPEGLRIRVRVRPGAGRDRLVGAHAGRLKVEVAAAPERGKANQALIRLLAMTFDVPRSAVALVAGAGSRDKTVSIRGLSAAAGVRRLEALGVPAA